MDPRSPSPIIKAPIQHEEYGFVINQVPTLHK